MELPLVKLSPDFVHWDDGIERVAILLDALLGDDLGVLRDNKTLSLQ